MGKSEGYVSREGEVGSPPHRGEEVIIGGRVGQVGGYIEWVGRVCWPCRKVSQVWFGMVWKVF